MTKAGFSTRSSDYLGVAPSPSAGFDSSFQQLNHTQIEFVGALHGASGGFTFAGGPTTLSGGPASNQFNTWAAFLLGLPTAMGRILQVPDEYTVRAQMHSLYVRDQWQVRRNLIHSLGTRWEYFPMPRRVVDRRSVANVSASRRNLSSTKLR